MKRNYISEVVRKFLGNEFPEKTTTNVQQWLTEEEHADEKEHALHSYWDSIPKEADKNTYVSLNEVKQKLGMKNQNTSSVFLRKRIWKVAAVLIPFFILAGGYIVYDSIWKERRIVKISVPYGERREILLPDHSTVWLNVGTTLKYPKKFGEKERTVELRGEAYFSVRKETDKPFIVDAGNMLIKVLGTEFNVRAYPDDEKNTTTLKTGKIEVQTSDKKAYVLIPDQQFSYYPRTLESAVATVSANDIQGWIDGHLVFEYNTLREIFQVLERRYRVVIETDAAVLAEEDRYSVKFISNEDIDQVMNILKEMGNFYYKRTGNKIHVHKK